MVRHVQGLEAALVGGAVQGLAPGVQAFRPVVQVRGDDAAALLGQMSAEFGAQAAQAARDDGHSLTHGFAPPKDAALPQPSINLV